jgi:outer membrane protein assembly factor BamD (BamD/ComL family)
MNRSLALGLISLLIVFAFTACYSIPESIPEDLEPREYLQEAQEAFDEGNYEAALLYLHTFLDRFPDDLENGYSARYQIAFIAYKRGQFEESTGLFQAIVDEYAEDPEGKPEWVLILSEKLIITIEELTTEEEPAPEESSEESTDEAGTEETTTEVS